MIQRSLNPSSLSHLFNLPWCCSFLTPPIEGKPWDGGLIFHTILCVKSKLMWRGLTCAQWEDQESISGICGQTQPRSASQWQFVVVHHAPWTRWGAGGAKWNANTGHISQGFLIGTQLLQGPSIPWSVAEAEEPVGHRDQVRFSSLCAAQNTWPKMVRKHWTLERTKQLESVSLYYILLSNSMSDKW